MDLPKPQIIMLSEKEAKLNTQKWLSDWILAHNLCPFAHRVYAENQIRFEVILANSDDKFLEKIIAEIYYLANPAQKKIDTSLLIFPEGFKDFDFFLDFSALVSLWLEQNDLNGVVQVVSFHPDYVFEGEDTHSRSHYTNRSPYPILHLLKEESIEKAIEHFPNVDKIPTNNIQKLERLPNHLFDWLNSFSQR